jgi:PAS domain S-box-containing protein
MKQPSEPEDWDDLRDRIIGFGEKSLHKSYYPELQKQMADLERFRALLDESHDAVYLIDARSGVVVDANRPTWEHFGYLPAGVVGRPFIDLIVPSERPRFLPFIDGSRDDRDDPHTIVLSLLKAFGGAVPVEVTLHTVLFGDDFYIVAVARDITARREAERELRIKESAISSSSDGILIEGLDGKVIYANDAFGRMFGCPDVADLKAGTRIEGLLEGSDEGPRLVEALRRDHATRTETKARRRDGTVFDIRISGSLVPDEEGRPLCLMFICQDITGLKAMEEMRRRAYEQLEQNIEQFAILGDHIRNPLQVIVGLACMIDDPLAGRIVEQCAQVNDIITELDRGWVMSENVRQYLRRREGIDL